MSIFVDMEKRTVKAIKALSRQTGAKTGSRVITSKKVYNRKRADRS